MTELEPVTRTRTLALFEQFMHADKMAEDQRVFVRTAVNLAFDVVEALQRADKSLQHIALALETIAETREAKDAA